MVFFIIVILVAIAIGISDESFGEAIGVCIIGGIMALLFSLIAGGIVREVSYVMVQDGTYPLYAIDTTYVQHDGKTFTFIAIDENGFYRNYSVSEVTVVYSDEEPVVRVYHKEPATFIGRILSIVVEDKSYQLYVPEGSVSFINSLPVVVGG